MIKGIEKKAAFLVLMVFLTGSVPLFAQAGEDENNGYYGENASENGDAEYTSDENSDATNNDDETSDESYPEEDPVFEIVRTGTLDEIRSNITEKKDSDGNSLLSVACEAGRDKTIISYLVGSGAQVETRNLVGITPLMFACQNETDVSVIDFLIKHGSKINVADEDGKTPDGVDYQWSKAGRAGASRRNAAEPPRQRQDMDR